MLANTLKAISDIAVDDSPLLTPFSTDNACDVLPLPIWSFYRGHSSPTETGISPAYWQCLAALRRLGTTESWRAPTLSDRRVELWAKRAVDLFIAGFGVVLLLPAFLLAAILSRLIGKGPLLYSQQRVGLHGKIFRVYKFRTMVVNGDKLGSTVTVKNDPRITRLGKYLRWSKMDELPQLFNVLKGDMSLVGPRPDVPGFADQLRGEDRIILTVRPGITGPATLKYRNEEELLAQQADPVKYNAEVLFPDKVRLNRQYVETMSLWGDIRYLVKTIFRV